MYRASHRNPQFTCPQSSACSPKCGDPLAWEVQAAFSARFYLGFINRLSGESTQHRKMGSVGFVGATSSGGLSPLHYLVRIACGKPSCNLAHNLASSEYIHKGILTPASSCSPEDLGLVGFLSYCRPSLCHSTLLTAEFTWPRVIKVK